MWVLPASKSPIKIRVTKPFYGHSSFTAFIPFLILSIIVSISHQVASYYSFLQSYDVLTQSHYNEIISKRRTELHLNLSLEGSRPAPCTAVMDYFVRALYPFSVWCSFLIRSVPWLSTSSLQDYYEPSSVIRCHETVPLSIAVFNVKIRHVGLYWLLGSCSIFVAEICIAVFTSHALSIFGIHV